MWLAVHFSGISSVVGVAEWFKAPGCGPGDRGFESLRPPHRSHLALLGLLLLPLLLLAACGGDGGGAPTASPAASAEASPAPSSPEVSPTPSSASVELPEGFPNDFPIYDKATITAARRIEAAQGNIYAVGMQTSEGADSVRSFYEARLAEAPWEVTNVVEITEEDTVVVEFARRGGGEAGTVAIQQEQTDGRKTLITVSLPAPATAATPASSPAP